MRYFKLVRLGTRTYRGAKVSIFFGIHHDIAGLVSNSFFHLFQSYLGNFSRIFFPIGGIEQF